MRGNDSDGGRITSEGGGGGGGGKQYLLIKDFNTFMFDYSLHGGRKHFCCYSLNSFVTEEILKHNIKDCFKINGNQRIAMPKSGEC